MGSHAFDALKPFEPVLTRPGRDGLDRAPPCLNEGLLDTGASASATTCPTAQVRDNLCTPGRISSQRTLRRGRGDYGQITAVCYSLVIDRDHNAVTQRLPRPQLVLKMPVKSRQPPLPVPEARFCGGAIPDDSL